MLAPQPGYQQQQPPQYLPPHPASSGGGGPLGLAFHLPSSSGNSGLVGGAGGGGAVAPALRSSGVAQLFPVAAGGNSLLQGGAFEDAPVRAFVVIGGGPSFFHFLSACVHIIICAYLGPKLLNSLEHMYIHTHGKVGICHPSF